MIYTTWVSVQEWLLALSAWPCSSLHIHCKASGVIYHGLCPLQLKYIGAGGYGKVFKVGISLPEGCPTPATREDQSCPGPSTLAAMHIGAEPQLLLTGSVALQLCPPRLIGIYPYLQKLHGFQPACTAAVLKLIRLEPVLCLVPAGSVAVSSCGSQVGALTLARTVSFLF